MRIILVGSGHLAHRIRALASADGREIVALSRENIRTTSEGEPRFESIVRMVRDADLSRIASAYLVDDCDEVNLVGEEASPEAELVTQDDRRRLHAAMAQLPAKQRAVITLKIEQGLSYQEICQILGGTAGAARVNYCQALKTLKKQSNCNYVVNGKTNEGMQVRCYQRIFEELLEKYLKNKCTVREFDELVDKNEMKKLFKQAKKSISVKDLNQIKSFEKELQENLFKTKLLKRMIQQRLAEDL